MKRRTDEEAIDNRVTSFAWKEIEDISVLLRPYTYYTCKRIFEEAMKQRNAWARRK